LSLEFLNPNIVPVTIFWRHLLGIIQAMCGETFSTQYSLFMRDPLWTLLYYYPFPTHFFVVLEVIKIIEKKLKSTQNRRASKSFVRRFSKGEERRLIEMAGRSSFSLGKTKLYK